MRAILAAACALSLAACAANTGAEVSTPAGGATVNAGAQAGAVNPVGAFEFTTQVNGQPMNGNVEVSGTPGAYTGRITTSMLPPLPITSVTVSGQQMTVVAQMPEGNVTINMTFTGQTFTGNWAIGGDSGSLSGRRTR